MIQKGSLIVDIFLKKPSWNEIDLTEKCWFSRKNRDRVLVHSVHSVENADILSHTFFAKISWKQWFY